MADTPSNFDPFQELPDPAARADAKEDYARKADALNAALYKLAKRLNVFVAWLNALIAWIVAARAAMATSQDAAAQSVKDAAGQVRLATDQVAAAKGSADAAARSLASSETVAAAVRAQINMPSLAGQKGKYWRVADDEKTLELVPLLVNQVGDILVSTQAPDSTWVPTGAIYFQSQYPKLFAKLGKVADWRIDQFGGAALPTSQNVIYYSAGAYGAGKFVISGLNQQYNQYWYYYSSDNGVTWNYTVSPISNYTTGLIWTGTQFLAVLNSGMQIQTSPDGINWTASQGNVLPSFSNSWINVVYGNGVYIACANQADSRYARTTSNPSTTLWAQQTLPDNFNSTWITFQLGLFVAYAANSQTYYTSPDGLTWTKRAGPGSYTGVIAATDTVAAWVINNSIYISYDMISWQLSTVSNISISSISAGGGNFLALSNVAGQTLLSADGVKWVQKSFPLAIGLNQRAAFGNNYFIVPQYNNAAVYRFRSHSYSTANQFFTTEAVQTPAGVNQYIKAS